MFCQVSYNNKDALKCQYQNKYQLASPNSLIQFDKKHWCYFHCPIKNTEGISSEKSKWNEQIIKNFYSDLDILINFHVENKKSDIDLSYTVFPNHAMRSDFIERLTSHRIVTRFDSCKFYGKIDLSKKDFSNFNFSNAHFYELISLVNCEISNTYFFNAKFFGGSSFISCTFVNCSFEKSNFYKSAVFTESHFFNLTTMEEESNLNNATFHEDVFFNNSVFDPKFTFKNLTFSKLADFSFSESCLVKKNFIGNIFYSIKFENCKFEEVNFNNRIFKSTTDFSSCVFNKAPYFFNCIFHQHTIFPPQKNFKDTHSKSAAHAYRALYRAMSDLRDRGYESMFYALIQKSERKSGIQPFHVRIASWLYEKITNYGQDIGMPLLWLLVITLLFSLCYAMLKSPIINFSASINWAIIGNGIDTSIKQIVKPFSFYSDSGNTFFNSLTTTDRVYFKIFAISQTIFSWSLITLFLLSMRWKFKKD
ncbi:MAG TPA: hypothetical protein VLI69_03125 [Gammaproteobacteria bacterium]|nr:hypothetical protein [Gammaproteobacteria bacterium]